jgi:hypothetical protein
MKRTRHVLAITLVTVALCADRAVAAAPVLRPQVASAAGKLVTRLSVTFRRVVPSVRVYQTSGESVAVLAPVAPAIDQRPSFGLRLSPMLLRLPPPVLA